MTDFSTRKIKFVIRLPPALLSAVFRLVVIPTLTLYKLQVCCKSNKNKMLVLIINLKFDMILQIKLDSLKTTAPQFCSNTKSTADPTKSRCSRLDTKQVRVRAKLWPSRNWDHRFKCDCCWFHFYSSCPGCRDQETQINIHLPSGYQKIALCKLNVISVLLLVIHSLCGFSCDSVTAKALQDKKLNFGVNYTLKKYNLWLFRKLVRHL